MTIAIWRKSQSIKTHKAIRLPVLEDWNYGPCSHHKTPRRDCAYQQCGGPLDAHQTVSAVFHFAAMKSMNASSPGVGKTNAVLATLCLIKHYKQPLKTVIVVPTSAITQWMNETSRFAPGLKTIAVTSGLTKPERQRVYASEWEVLIIGYHLLVSDVKSLTALNPLQVISDDVDPLTHHKNKTHKAIVDLSKNAERVIILNATNIQTQLTQLHAAAIPVVGEDGLWGNQYKFEKMFIQKEPVMIETTRLDDHKKRVKTMRKVMQAKGVKNMDILTALYDLICIRYSYEDLEDSADIPSVVSETVWLDLYPEQRRKYEQLQQGLLELNKKEFDTPQQRLVAALAKFTFGAMVCAGLPALGEEDGEGASSKLDWVEEKILNAWADEKVVVYAKNRGTIEALQDRLDRDKVGFGTIWGKEPSPEARAEEQRRFREDPECRVMIISSAGERSLNLQYARILVLLDSQYNPARLRQIVGRIRRVGSKFKRLFVFVLYTTDTQEERIGKILATRQAIADAAAGDEADGLFESLTADELLRLISP